MFTYIRILQVTPDDVGVLANLIDVVLVALKAIHLIIQDSKVVLCLRIVSIHKQRALVSRIAFIAIGTIIVDGTTIISITVVLDVDIMITKDGSLFRMALNTIRTLLPLHKSSWRQSMRILQGEDECLVVILEFD